MTFFSALIHNPALPCCLLPFPSLQEMATSRLQSRDGFSNKARQQAWGTGAPQPLDPALLGHFLLIPFKGSPNSRISLTWTDMGHRLKASPGASRGLCAPALLKHHFVRTLFNFSPSRTQYKNNPPYSWYLYERKCRQKRKGF